jgi:NADPH-dependent 2,4-dienoyl-CoA reductase/sulfur reductase-like enzyme
MKIIIGGIAAGLSTASQIKRQATDAAVVVLEKGGDVSYAACGMPYNLFYRYTPVEDLYVLSFETITGRGIDFRQRHEVVAIDPLRQEVSILNHQPGVSTGRATTSSSTPPVTAR